MRRLLLWVSVILLGGSFVADAQVSDTLPPLDGNSSKGLEITCRLVKTTFVVGEPVNVWCTVQNTTDSIKSVGWHSVTGVHFCYVKEGQPVWAGGLLPLALPQLPRPVMIKTNEGRPGYVLYIPAHGSIQFLLTHKETQPIKFKGRVVYDPVSPRNGFLVVKEEGPPWKNELVSSNEFEYEVVASGKGDTGVRVPAASPARGLNYPMI